MGRVITAPGVLTNVQGQIDHALDLYQDIKDNNLKPLTITIDPVTNANGEYSHTTEDDRITEDMKAVTLEVGTPEVFGAPITITTADGEVTLTCSNAHGTSTVTVTFIHTWPVDGGEDVPASVTSTEFDILADRIGPLSTLDTTDKSSIVGAVNELVEDKVNKTDIVNNLTTNDATKPLSAAQGYTLNGNIGTLNQMLSGVKFVSFQISSGVSVTLNLGNTFRGILFCSSVYNVSAGVFNVVSNNSGGASVSTIAGGSDITFNTTVNNKITVSSINYAVCTLMILLSEASIAS